MSAVFDFKGHHALITGGARGIGYTITHELHKFGCKITAIGQNLENLQKLKQELPDISIIAVDLANWSDTEAKLKAHLQDIGHCIDLVVNNAGISMPESIGHCSEAVFDRTFAINVKAAINISQLIAEQLIKNGQKGNIVNVSSQASFRGFAQHMIYGASKAALDQVTRHFALEYGGKGIRVNSVNPTVVLTDMSKANWDKQSQEAFLKKIPLARFAQEKEISDVVLFLLSDLSSMVHGVTLPVDGGYLACA